MSYLQPNPCLLLLTTLLAACSSPEDSANRSDPGSADSEVGAVTTDEGTAVTRPSEPGETPEALITTEPEPVGTIEAVDATPSDECAISSAPSKLAQVNLYIALDRSASMGAGAYDRRWEPLSLALKSFFSDEQSEGVSAELQFFPPPALTLRGAGCALEDYPEAEVPLMNLPDQATFASVIDGVELRGGTPMTAALSISVRSAEAQLTAEPESSVAIILVTDGYPNSDGCNGRGIQNSLHETVNLAASVADRFPVYVIALGETLEEMNKVAAAGGTESAVLVSVTDPEVTRVTVLDRLSKIRREVVSCDVPIPAPPQGRQLEPTKVAAQIVRKDAPAEEIPFEADCATGAGWRYDDPANPGTIELCSGPCSQIQTQTDANLEVVFGCTENPRITQAIK